MELANLKAVYDSSPVGFALGEIEYDKRGEAVNFYIRYINKPGAAALNSLPQNLIDKPYITMFPETDQQWITGFSHCARTGEKQSIKGFSVPLGKYLSLLCFRRPDQMLGCFITEMTNEAVANISHHGGNRVMTAEEHQFSSIITQFSQEQPAEQAPETVLLFHDCITILTGNYRLEESLQLTLSRICSYFGADKGSITMFYGLEMKAFWAAEGRLEPLFISQMPTVEALMEWSALLGTETYLEIRDCSDEQIPPAVREHCRKLGIRLLHLLPVFMDGLLGGFVMLSNISLNQSHLSIMHLVISTVSRLIHSRIEQENNRRMQFRDTLTGYLNLEGFLQTAKKLIRTHSGVKYALWYCDLKRFKYINDMFGYHVGDELLKHWANICHRGSRAGETFGRAAADNFVLLRWYQEEQDITEAFARDEAALADFAQIKSRGYTPELTCGIYLLDEADMKNPDVSKIMDKANIAQQFTHNKTGPHFAIYDESMRQRQMREMDIGQHMREGIRSGEFSIWMQPQYSYAEGTIVGAEALVRWQHPQMGCISPGEFIPVLERTGQVTELDLYVWEEACKYIRHTLDHADKMTAIPISINISRRDIYMMDLEHVLLQLIKKYDLEPAMLRLEITESAYMENPKQLIEVAKRLQNCGFVIEMDDFGSGFSSLNILKDVPVEVLKLDMNFLAGTDNIGGRQGNILSSVIRMARWLGMELIAEGVETVEQAEYLKNLGCSYMQGYYFAKPMCRRDFDVLLADDTVKKGWMGLAGEKKVFNSGQFLERQSEAAYLFNSCIGGAALLEYEADRLEVILMNDRFLEVHGITYKTACRHWNNIFDFCSEESREMIRAGAEAAVCKGSASVELCFGKTKDKWVKATFRHLSANQGSHMFFVLADDITHQKQTEAKLAETAKRLQDLMK